MDPQIKKRLMDKVKIYPLLKISSGDKIFGDAIEISSIVIPKIGDVSDDTGEKHTYSNKVILDGNVDMLITNNDEIELDRIGRVPIKAVASYNSLKPGKQLIEVYC